MTSTIKVDRIQNQTGTIPYLEHGSLKNVTIDSSCSLIANQRIVNYTYFTLQDYYISCPDYNNNKDTMVQIGSESWDVTLTQDNSDILIHGSIQSFGGFDSHGYFDLRFNDISWVGAQDGLWANHEAATDNKYGFTVNWYHDIGDNVKGTTVNYKPFVSQWSSTETVNINSYGSGNLNQISATQWIFAEVTNQ